MGTSVMFKPTTVQKKALALLKSGAKHILLFGGSRSGKTTVLVMAIIFRALRFPGSRHLICRYRAKDARSSVLRETLFPWLDNTIGKAGYNYLVHESVITLYNGSEIWIGGLGDREQADKILGHEYNTIYFNEVSQLSYVTVTTAYSRLAMKVDGCRNMFFYDCNPSSPLHWAYKIFVLKRAFNTGEPLEKAGLYNTMLLNPEDNKANLLTIISATLQDSGTGKNRPLFGKNCERDTEYTAGTAKGIKSNVAMYWMSFFKGRLFGEITAKDVDDFIDHIGQKPFSASWKNLLIYTGTIPLSWAVSKGMIGNNLASGHMKFSATPAKRHILTPAKAAAVFNAPWPNERDMLGNLLASVTGMRLGEIQACGCVTLGRTA